MIKEKNTDVMGKYYPSIVVLILLVGFFLYVGYQGSSAQAQLGESEASLIISGGDIAVQGSESFILTTLSQLGAFGETEFSLGAIATSTITNPWEFEQLLDFQNDVLFSNTTGLTRIDGDLLTEGFVTYSPDTLATTTSEAANTLVQDDFEDFGYYIVTPGDLVEGADLTYTTTATSSLTTYLNVIGASAEICFYLTATTSDSNLILAAGTGWDFVYSSSTATAIGLGPLQIGSEEMICIETWRMPDASGSQLGNIQGIIKAYEDLD